MSALPPLATVRADIAAGPLRADCVAKVALHWMPKTFRLYETIKRAADRLGAAGKKAFGELKTAVDSANQRIDGAGKSVIAKDAGKRKSVLNFITSDMGCISRLKDLVLFLRKLPFTSARLRCRRGRHRCMRRRIPGQRPRCDAKWGHSGRGRRDFRRSSTVRGTQPKHSRLHQECSSCELQASPGLRRKPALDGLAATTRPSRL